MEDLIIGALSIVMTLSSAFIIFIFNQLNNPIVILIFGIALFILFLIILISTIKNIPYKFSKEEIKADEEWLEHFSNPVIMSDEEFLFKEDEMTEYEKERIQNEVDDYNSNMLDDMD